VEFKVSKCESLYKGFFQFNKYFISNQLFAGGWSDTYTREIFERGHAAAILLFDENRDQLVFVEQFRPGAMQSEQSPWLIELVAGMIEEGELPEEVVKRESIEESGSKVKRLVKMCEYLVSPGGTTERIWLYLGEIDSTKTASFAGLESENEDIKVHCISTQKAFDWLDSGKINNAMTIIAVQWLKLRLIQQTPLWQ
jgi:ADP-ribose pyrophosphatase